MERSSTNEQAVISGLTAQRRLLLAASLLTVAAYGAAVACMILVSLSAAVWIVNITTVFYLLVVRTLDRRYNRAFARANLTMSCGRLLQDIQTVDKGALTREDLRARGLFPVPEQGKGLVCGMSVSGRVGTAQAQVCELTVYCDMSREQKKLSLLNGLWMELRLPADTGLQLALVQRKMFEPETIIPFYAKQGLAGLPLLESSLQEDFALYGNEASARAAARFVRRCLPLLRQAQKGGGRQLLALRGDLLCVFLTGRSLTFSTPIRGKLTPEIVGWDRLPELKLLLELGRELLPRAAE